MRAGGRGEAVRVRVGRYPTRWASRVLVSTCSVPLVVHFLLTGVRVLSLFGRFLLPRARFLLTGAWVLRPSE